MKREMSSCL